MTLFKKVFGDHAVGDQSDPAWPAQNDGFDFDDTYEDVIADRIAAVAAKTAPDSLAEVAQDPTASGEIVPDEPAQVDESLEGTLAQIASPLEPAADIEPEPEPEPEVEAELTMAERAALAQRQIKQSQNRHKPEPSQASVSPAPAPVLVQAPERVEPSEPAAQVASSQIVRDDVPKVDAQRAAEPVPAPSPEPAAVPAPRPGRAARRVRTRLLGFDQGGEENADPFEKAATGGGGAVQAFPVGWFVVVAGPGRGHSFAIFNGASTIGRGEDQAIKLDFGDNSISRQNHAAVAYDDEQNKFYLGHGGKSNIIRLNDRPVLSTEELAHSDTVRIGETTLRFVALCGAEFNWGMPCHDEG